MTRDYMGREEIKTERREALRKKRKPPVPSMFDNATKMCPECFRVVYNATRQCPACEYKFQRKGK